ncbi:unnamed protein product [Caenorhabditis bovis]|uniref:Uncharacterized protein n=1 Tax=Caenorhabditis bovis TaxID=2654633 RepID=A0A8S1EES7_9PELO|nr:unnamed protein product [Caenorhabditis bovis]
MRKTGDIRSTYEIFLISECPIHIINLLIILATPRFLFSNRALIHKNLKLLIISYLLGAFCLSTSRLAWLVLELLWTPIEIMEIFMYLRFVFQSSLSAHLFALTAERVTATITSKRYERNSCHIFIIFCCFLTYPFALLLLYSKYHFEKGRELNVAMTAICSLGAFSVMLVVLYINKKRLKERRFMSKISEAYQIRENIRTSRLLLNAFLIGLVFLGLGSFFVLRFSATLNDPNRDWETITNGFLYDILVSTGTTIGSFVFLHYMIPDDTMQRINRALNCPCTSTNHGVAPNDKRLSFKNINGINVEVGVSAEEEARVYFSQLSKSWN